MFERNPPRPTLPGVVNHTSDGFPNTSPVISVSELGDWEYCHLAWKLGRSGARPTQAAMVQAKIGVAHHSACAEVVSTAINARRSRAFCLVGAAVVGAILALCWISSQ